MSAQPIVIAAGGLSFLTADPFLIRAMRRCAELENELRWARRAAESSAMRRLPRDVRIIKGTVKRIAAAIEAEIKEAP